MFGGGAVNSDDEREMKWRMDEDSQDEIAKKRKLEGCPRNDCLKCDYDTHDHNDVQGCCGVCGWVSEDQLCIFENPWYEDRSCYYCGEWFCPEGHDRCINCKRQRNMPFYYREQFPPDDSPCDDCTQLFHDHWK